MSTTEQQLHRLPLFRTLPHEAIAELVSGAVSETFLPGDVLLRQGDASHHAIIIIEGEVEVLVVIASGEVKLASLPGVVLLGEIGTLADLPRTATVRAVLPGSLLKIDKAVFNRVADAHPTILRSVITQLGGQIGTYNRAVAVYTNALAALERDEFDEAMLANLNNPSPELMNFAETLRKMANQFVLRQRHLEEMASAAAIQQAMLPDPLPQDSLHQRVSMFAAMRPAREVGGDFYDAFFLDPDRLVVSMGDVSGKGVPAALFMAMCQTTLRMALREHPDDLGRALGRANSLLEAENKASMFATFFGAIIDLPTGRVSYCNCGHNPPLLQRSNGTLELLQPNGAALGVIDLDDYEAAQVTLERGDRLLLYTDGVTEANDEDGQFFGDERLAQAAASNRSAPPQIFIEGIIADLDSFVGKAPQHDDITCLVLDFSG
jgi:serine phosphatase RsbU (regulator of sigma subunit)